MLEVWNKIPGNSQRIRQHPWKEWGVNMSGQRPFVRIGKDHLSNVFSCTANRKFSCTESQNSNLCVSKSVCDPPPSPVLLTDKVNYLRCVGRRILLFWKFDVRKWMLIFLCNVTRDKINPKIAGGLEEAGGALVIIFPVLGQFCNDEWQMPFRL